MTIAFLSAFLFFPNSLIAQCTVAENVRVTYDSLASQHPTIEYNGNVYGIVWHNHRNSNSEIYFTVVSCKETPANLH